MNSRKKGSKARRPAATLHPTFLDLFCGCGGFSLGLMRAGFRCMGALDSDRTAVETYQKNLIDFRHPHLLPAECVMQADLRTMSPESLAERIGATSVDVVVGGPPCQGFSSARKVDGANHGSRLKHDPRRHLFEDFLRFVEFFRPRVFVMENVMGMRSAAGGEYFTAVQRAARKIGADGSGPRYRVHSQVEDARLLGVPQKRRRQLIVGVRMDAPCYLLPEVPPAPSATPNLPLGKAIGDLPPLSSASGSPSRAYDLPRRRRHLKKHGLAAESFLEEVLEVGLATELTSHVARRQSERDLRDFARLREGESSASAARDRGVEFEFPYSRESFPDRYTRQSRSGPCSTIVAHLAKDGLMFIHPTQNRTLTPREAARIQTFPDWFSLPSGMGAAFRLIGNAVPPLVAEAVGLHIRRFLQLPVRSKTSSSSPSSSPASLALTASLSPSHLRTLSKAELLSMWRMTLDTFAYLHPENARDLGEAVEGMGERDRIAALSSGLSGDCHARSGWPTELAGLAREVIRRESKGALLSSELYLLHP